MSKRYLKYALKDRVYRADAKDLGLPSFYPPHDVIVMSVNKRRNRCKVKTITSLERLVDDGRGNKKSEFLGRRLDDDRTGKITVIPKNELRTKHLSGVHNDELTIKTNKLYFSNTGVVFPRRYKNIIKKAK